MWECPGNNGTHHSSFVTNIVAMLCFTLPLANLNSNFSSITVNQHNTQPSSSFLLPLTIASDLDIPVTYVRSRRNRCDFVTEGSIIKMIALL